MSVEPSQLPDGWGWVPVGDLCERLAKGRTPKYDEAGPLVIKTRHVYPDGFPQYPIERSTASYRPDDLVRPGDLLMTAMGRGSIGRLSIITDCPEPMVTDGCILTIRCKPSILPLWLYHYLRSDHGQREILARETGTAFADNRGQTQVKPANFATILVPVPYPSNAVRSVDEQRRIVARIVALFDRIEEAQRLRVAAVDDAVRLIDSVRDDVFRELERSVSTNHQLDAIAESRLGKMLSKEAKKGSRPRPYLRNANVQWDCIDLDDLYEMDFDESEEEKYGLRPGDLLVCEGGEIGRAAVWQGELKECYFQKALHRLRLRDSRAPSRYLMHFIAWASTSGAIAKLKTGSAIPHLTGVRLRTLEIIWPTASEQHRIVEYLDGVQAQVAELKRLQAQSAAELERLDGAVLARAFQGEL